MMAYIATMKFLLGKILHHHIGLDGTSVSTKDMDVYVVEELPSGRSAWLHPKALFVVAQIRSRHG